MTLSRRQLIKSAAASVSIATLAPNMVFSGVTRRDDMLRIAAIGFGGRGKSDMNGMKDHKSFQLTHACDVDKSFHGIADEFGDKVAKFQDYRELFKSSSKDFDAVLIATPDHMHAPIALMAMEHDKHVYLQKPLAQDIMECRKLAEASVKKPNLKTQMGIQIHAHAFYRTAVKWLQSGLIGTVNDVHSWSGKGWGGEQPEKESAPVPSISIGTSTLAFPRARIYRGLLPPKQLAKVVRIGTGTQGDMGCHIVDPVFTALELKEPTEVTSLGPEPFKENFALISQIVHKFKGTQYTTPEINLTWYNGSLRPKELGGVPKEVELPHQGSVFVGEKGSLILPHIGEPSVFNLDGTPMENLPEAEGHSNHFHDWIDACVGEKEQAGAPFEYSGPLTEAVLLGTVINRWPKLAFSWDAKNCKFTGDNPEVAEANALLAPVYRSGW